MWSRRIQGWGVCGCDHWAFRFSGETVIHTLMLRSFLLYYSPSKETYKIDQQTSIKFMKLHGDFHRNYLCNIYYYFKKRDCLMNGCLISAI